MPRAVLCPLTTSSYGEGLSIGLEHAREGGPSAGSEDDGRLLKARPKLRMSAKNCTNASGMLTLYLIFNSLQGRAIA